MAVDLDETTPTAGPSRLARARGCLPVAVAVLLLLPVAVVGFVWFENTKALDATQVVGPVAPGEQVTVEDHKPNGCGATYDRLYRRVAGRWLQTHWRNESAAQGWSPADQYDLWTWPRSHQEFSDLPCPIGGNGFVNIPVPADVSTSPIMACTFDDDECVLINVEH